MNPCACNDDDDTPDPEFMEDSNRYEPTLVDPEWHESMYATSTPPNTPRNPQTPPCPCPTQLPYQALTHSLTQLQASMQRAPSRLPRPAAGVPRPPAAESRPAAGVSRRTAVMPRTAVVMPYSVDGMPYSAAGVSYPAAGALRPELELSRAGPSQLMPPLPFLAVPSTSTGVHQQYRPQTATRIPAPCRPAAARFPRQMARPVRPPAPVAQPPRRPMAVVRPMPSMQQTPSHASPGIPVQQVSGGWRAPQPIPVPQTPGQVFSPIDGPPLYTPYSPPRRVPYRRPPAQHLHSQEWYDQLALQPADFRESLLRNYPDPNRRPECPCPGPGPVTVPISGSPMGPQPQQVSTDSGHRIQEIARRRMPVRMPQVPQVPSMSPRPSSASRARDSSVPPHRQLRPQPQVMPSRSASAIPRPIRQQPAGRQPYHPAAAAEPSIGELIELERSGHVQRLDVQVASHPEQYGNVPPLNLDITPADMDFPGTPPARNIPATDLHRQYEQEQADLRRAHALIPIERMSARQRLNFPCDTCSDAIESGAVAGHGSCAALNFAENQSHNRSPEPDYSTGSSSNPSWHQDSPNYRICQRRR